MTGGMGMGMGGMEFGFDGRTFDPARTDQELDVGTLEEWTIRNATMMDHPFHLHVWPMQVLDAPDVDSAGPPDWRDTVIVPAGSQVTVRVAVRDFGGRTVYESPDVHAIRRRTQEQLASFHDGVKRFLNPHRYPVGLDAGLFDLRTRLVLEARGLKS